MNIGIIGSGIVGQQLGLGFIKLGHEVKVGSRDASKLVEWEKNAGEKASKGSFEGAAKFGEVIILATSWSGTQNAISISGKENFNGKVVIDVTNPLDFSEGAPPKFAVELGNSGGEQVQNWLPNSKVVKAFNTISAYTMCNPELEEGAPDLFIAGNDDEAKKTVSSYADKWGWANIVDLGDISQSYWLETLAMLWINFAFKNNQWTHAFKLLRK